ncbi:MAG: hypothetical protein JKX88_03955 [Marinicaulis sp.]|nr:hypothetical protein [Marinicaulis sp.]
MIAAYDLLVGGGDEASLCAAACAARSGARVGLLRSRREAKRRADASICAVPNFVWRRLDLQDFGIKLEPVSARVTLMAEDQSVATYASPRATDEALAKNGSEDHLLWQSFVGDMAQLNQASSAANGSASPKNGVKTFTAFLADRRQLSALGQLSGSCTDLLDDYFSDPKLKTHVAAHALGVAGLGGRELGTASVLPEFLDESAWRVRVGEGQSPLRTTLETICEESGVTMIEGALQLVSIESGKYKTVEISGGETLKARVVFFASPEAAVLAGVETPFLSLPTGRSATAIMRFKLKKSIEPPAADETAMFQIVDSIKELQEARDCAVNGQLPDPLPIEFEFADNGDLIAQTKYCPKAFKEENEWRDWTGQDRQIVAARILKRLVSRMPDMTDAVKKSKITMLGADDGENSVSAIAPPDLILVQPDRHNAIGAAVHMVDEVLGYE